MKDEESVKRKPTETCPSCHQGTLVSVEERPDGSSKHFSCGHTQHSVTLTEKLSLGASLDVEHRLGPHSAETVTHSRSHGANAFVVSMQQEMYKDALHFYRDACMNHGKNDADPFVTWRSLRAAILFTFAAIESCINQFIDTHVEANKAGMTQKEVDRWTEKDRYVSISEKLKEGVRLFSGERLDKDKTLWQDYEELKNLRDDLIRTH